ncbi:hypothetical protein AKJ09_05625 [Labilithrix luteola]|uniref:Uncharacterized protein n=2 Tax=Labilithrix luteola TaxID=1391654 RepID=A0A0K1PZZ4_9BACT|nr:hypothetical protein AKJ09_05625 [Labilithrix luteola]
MMSLEARLASVREESSSWAASSWTAARSQQVFAHTLQRREARARQSRLLKRCAFVASASGMLVMLLLRGGPSPRPSEVELASAQFDAAPSTSLAVAARDSSDAGFGRD